MPEGDTIYRSADRLRRALVGEQIVDASCHNPRVERPLPAERVVGQTCVRVEARGKHLLMHLGSGDAIHSHLGMTGSWHLYRPGEVWQKPTHYAAVALATEPWKAVCFTPPTLELLTRDQVRRHRQLSRLGPDLLDPDFNATEAVSRLRRAAAAPVGVAVMNQQLVCGIGNVYKSEILFLEQLDPFAPIGQLTDEQLHRLLDRARMLMQRNLSGMPRQTRFRGDVRLWVYGRLDEPCLKCGQRIQMRRQGEAGRTTYWCPTCQYAPGGIKLGP